MHWELHPQTRVILSSGNFLLHRVVIIIIIIIIYLFWAAQEKSVYTIQCRTGHKGLKHLQVSQTKPNNKNTKKSSNVNNAACAVVVRTVSERSRNYSELFWKSSPSTKQSWVDCARNTTSNSANTKLKMTRWLALTLNWPGPTRLSQRVSRLTNPNVIRMLCLLYNVIEQYRSITVNTTLEVTIAIANELLNKRQINLQATVYAIIVNSSEHGLNILLLGMNWPRLRLCRVIEILE